MQTMIHTLAERMAKYISKNTSATSKESAKINYGLEIISGWPPKIGE